MLTHTPPEDWREICNRCNRLSAAHRAIKGDDREGAVPTVSMDSAFLRRRMSVTALPMRVLRENTRGETRSHGWLSKHIDVRQGSYAINSAVGDSEATGYKRIVLKQ